MLPCVAYIDSRTQFPSPRQQHNIRTASSESGSCAYHFFFTIAEKSQRSEQAKAASHRRFECRLGSWSKQQRCLRVAVDRAQLRYCRLRLSRAIRFRSRRPLTISLRAPNVATSSRWCAIYLTHESQLMGKVNNFDSDRLKSARIGLNSTNI